MEIRDYALANNITTDFENDTIFSNLPEHFQAYVNERLPGEFSQSNFKNGNDMNQVQIHLSIQLYDSLNLAGASRQYTVTKSNYGSFRNRAESASLVAGGVTVFCDWIWFGGRKWVFATIPPGADFFSLGSANNRFDSHF